MSQKISPIFATAIIAVVLAVAIVLGMRMLRPSGKAPSGPIDMSKMIDRSQYQNMGQKPIGQQPGGP